MRLVAICVATLASLAARAADDISAACIEERRAITQGVYGLVTYQSDVSLQTNPPTPVAGELIEILDKPAGAAVARTSSDESGVLQAELPADAYALCGTSRCITFEVPAGRRVRGDLRSGFGNY